MDVQRLGAAGGSQAVQCAGMTQVRIRKLDITIQINDLHAMGRKIRAKRKGPALRGLQELGARAFGIEQSDCRFRPGLAPLEGGSPSDDQCPNNTPAC